MELPSRFDPKQQEPLIYAAWKEQGAFQPRAGRGSPFTIMIPPPNVTGVLHMGHALNNTIQDIVARHRRMAGRETLWLPGTDHAGIATQAVVEKMLLKERNLRRADMGRAAFVAEVWRWKDTHGSKILQQLERLGSSCDWSRTRFTLEEGLSRAVREAFVRLWEKGLVYRGARLVNWDCALETAVSDDEIEMVERKDKLYTLHYPVHGGGERTLGVATTRPETMLGDTGVAVHPADLRHRDLIGRELELPFVDRRIPVLGDETVEPGFGTGAVKITPGHDPADYERGARFRLPIVNVLTKDGRLNENGGPFAGLTREKAREAVLAALESRGLLAKVEELVHSVPISDRSKSVIEPLVSEQWFVRMQPLAQPAIAAVREGRLRFVPERWTKVYLDWLLNVRDWCISRQLWWGHRIPVWYDEDGEPIASREDLALGSRHPRTGKPIVRQDEDVLDTWASSWLWPFATLGWPDETADLARFYPTQFLSTARDIIYLWVARMVMAGYEFLDHLPHEQRCPFAVVNVHATVLDAQGRRMSKSLGNGIDPLEMIDKYGADAVRYSLILLTREGQDVKLAPERFEQGFRFGNKVWNAARFVLQHVGTSDAPENAVEAGPSALEDRWIRSRSKRSADLVSRALEEYRLNDAATELYRFVWNDFCDWYLELAKPRLAGADPSARAARETLVRVLADTLALLHPFTPFQTEALWGYLCQALGRERTLLATSAWPTGEGLEVDEQAEGDMAVIQDLVASIRNVRALTSLGERKPLKATIAAPRERERRVLQAHRASAQALSFLESYELVERSERPPRTAVAVTGGIEAFVHLDGEVDTRALKQTLTRRAEKLRGALSALDAKLANAGFLERAQAEVIESERARRRELDEELALLERNAAGL
jgi:valyl-tRNA synthetase